MVGEGGNWGGGWCKGTLMVRRRSADWGRSRIRVRRMAVEVGSGWVVVVVVVMRSCDGGAAGGVAVARRERVGVGELIIGKRALVCL